jgi:hypothetical protein
LIGMSRQELIDLAGFLAAVAAVLAAILLVFPLFHLLRARQTIEDLERKLDQPGWSSDQRDEMTRSLAALRRRVRDRRKIAIRIAVLGSYC